jgi:peptidoglycan/LPS O-acetylase OafA/YrhL
MLFHLGFWAWAVPGSTPGRLLQGAASFPELSGFWWGRFGVEIFFVISGFVIAFSASQSSLAHFISSRFFRLFPTAAICATFTFFALWVADARPVDELLSM